MPFKAKYGIDFTIKNNRIHLSTDYLLANNKKFKKITGSRLASIINRNQYTSPAKMWAIMTNIYYEEMDETLSFVGNAIEPKVKKYVEEKLDISFKQYNPFEVKWDVFDDPIFGGIPDGEPIDNNGNFLYDKNLPMLEIKTTSIDSFVYKNENGVLKLQKDDENIPLVKLKGGKLESWYNEKKEIEVPLEYKLQLSLYLYLRNISKGIFAIAFLEKEDYARPEEFDPKTRKIELVELTLDHDAFSKIIDIARDWYNQHIISGISPELGDDDKFWLSDLKKS